jgi:hypothetical protein
MHLQESQMALRLQAGVRAGMTDWGTAGQMMRSSPQHLTG